MTWCGVWFFADRHRASRSSLGSRRERGLEMNKCFPSSDTSDVETRIYSIRHEQRINAWLLRRIELDSLKYIHAKPRQEGVCLTIRDEIRRAPPPNNTLISRLNVMIKALDILRIT